MKQLRIGALLLLFSMVSTQAQEARLDSMLRVVKTQGDDTIKINTLGKIYVMQLFMDPVAAKKHPFSIIRLSKKIGYEEGITRAHLYLGNYHQTLMQKDSARYYFEECIRLADKPFEFKLRVNALAGLGNLFSELGEFEKAIRLKDSVAKLYLELGDYLFYGGNIGDIGYCYYSMGDYVKASEKTLEALRILDTISEQPVRKADLFRRMGHINWDQDNTEKAFDYYQKAQKIYIEASDYLYQAYVLSDMGNIRWAQKQYEEALSYFREALALGEKYNYTEMVGVCSNNMGALYTEIKEYDKALPYQLKGFEIIQKTGQILNIISSNIAMGELYSQLGKHQQALIHFDRSVHLADSTQALAYLSNALLSRAGAYEKAGNLRKAIRRSKSPYSLPGQCIQQGENRRN